jgi:hypothetical protein
MKFDATLESNTKRMILAPCPAVLLPAVSIHRGRSNYTTVLPAIASKPYAIPELSIRISSNLGSNFDSNFYAK